MTRKHDAGLQDGDCIHGLERFACATCYHPPGTCGYGDCQRTATVKVVGNTETRRCCNQHGEWLQNWGEGTIQPLPHPRERTLS